MAFSKIASPGDWGHFNDQQSCLVKISAFGLMPNDSAALIKIAGDRFAHEVKQIEDTLRKDCQYLHAVSCGATEVSGPNRNGDGWRAEVLTRDMPTYVKHAKLFREHNNKKDSPFYGRTKLAFYDETRGYGRVLAEYNATQKAADELGGLVADKELDKLAKDGEIPLSHGTTVGTDVCHICGNKATKRAEYCQSKEEGGTCDLFGCWSGLTKIADDGRIQYVDNPNNIFYDLSFVGTPADRIAYGVPMTFEKTASAIYIPVHLPARYDLYLDKTTTQFQAKLAAAAAGLAEAEVELSFDPDVLDFEKKAAYLAHMGNPGMPIEVRGLVNPDPYVKRGAAHKLLQQRQLPSAGQMAKAAGLSVSEQQQADDIAVGLIERLFSNNSINALIKSSAFTRSPLTANSHYLAQIASAPGYSFDEKEISRRALKLALFNDTLTVPLNKTAQEYTPAATEIALEHAALKIAMAANFAIDDKFSLILLSHPRRS